MVECEIYCRRGHGNHRENEKNLGLAYGFGAEITRLTAVQAGPILSEAHSE